MIKCLEGRGGRAARRGGHGALRRRDHRGPSSRGEERREGVPLEFEEPERGRERIGTVRKNSFRTRGRRPRPHAR